MVIGPVVWSFKLLVRLSCCLKPLLGALLALMVVGPLVWSFKLLVGLSCCLKPLAVGNDDMFLSLTFFILSEIDKIIEKF